MERDAVSSENHRKFTLPVPPDIPRINTPLSSSARTSLGSYRA